MASMMSTLLHPPDDNATLEEWQAYWAALKWAEEEAEASAQRILDILAA